MGDMRMSNGGDFSKEGEKEKTGGGSPSDENRKRRIRMGQGKSWLGSHKGSTEKRTKDAADRQWVDYRGTSIERGRIKRGM